MNIKSKFGIGDEIWCVELRGIYSSGGTCPKCKQGLPGFEDESIAISHRHIMKVMATMDGIYYDTAPAPLRAMFASGFGGIDYPERDCFSTKRGATAEADRRRAKMKKEGKT